MAARRSVKSLSETFHGLTLGSAQPGRLAGLTSRLSSSRSSCAARAAPSHSASAARCFSASSGASAPLASASASSTAQSSSASFSTSSAAAATPSPAAPASSSSSSSLTTSASPSFTAMAARTVPVTVFAFPTLEPRSLEMWSAQHLHLPLRRDLLHLAVVYEGDNTRQGTASSKTRYEVHGSHRKMRPQKGSGAARVGTRQSPVLRGGGKTFGPKPRDFGTDLNRKMYDRAWRTALSYRYRRGELIVCENGMELPLPDAFLRLAQDGALDRALEDGFVQRYVRTLLNGKDNDLVGESAAAATAGGTSSAVTGIVTKTTSGIGSLGQAWGREGHRTTFITSDHRPNLFTSLAMAGEHGRAMELKDVDVKDLLETGRIVIERDALQEMVERHQSDLVSRIYVHGARSSGPVIGQQVV